MKKTLLLFGSHGFITMLSLINMAFAQGQCGVNMSCVDPNPKPGVCNVSACFLTLKDQQKYEQDNKCKFPAQVCGDKPIDTTTQCCGKDAKTGKTDTVVNRQITAQNSSFDWSAYQRQCPNMRQSEATPDALWAQCVVGQRHSAADDWPVREVIQNPDNPKARSYCVDGCSTPPFALTAAYNTNIFLVKDKDNPTGHPNSSFYNACKAHDLCYQSCKANTQLSCDAGLRDQSTAQCQSVPENATTTITTLGITQQVNTRVKCVAAANRMFNILSDLTLGSGAFNLRRQQMCQCC